MNIQQNSQINRAAMEFAQALQKYPVEVAVGVGLVIPNLVNGCSWGFITDKNDEYNKIIKNIQENPNMASFKIKGGYLYSIKMDYLLNILGKVAGGYVTKKDLEIASQHRQDSLLKADKYLKKVKGTMRKGSTVKVGIYNLNDSPRITVAGETYSSFCITLADLLAFCVRQGYNIKVKDGDNTLILTPNQASNNMVKLVSTLEVAPSGNSLLIDLVSE